MKKKLTEEKYLVKTYSVQPELYSEIKKVLDKKDTLSGIIQMAFNQYIIKHNIDNQ
jgi:hypothetical protein